jgi:hypothetical protein
MRSALQRRFVPSQCQYQCNRRQRLLQLSQLQRNYATEIENDGSSNIPDPASNASATNSTASLPDNQATAVSSETQSASSTPPNPRESSQTSEENGEEPWNLILPPHETAKFRNCVPESVLHQTSMRKRLVWQAPTLKINPAYDLALQMLDQEQKRIRKNLKDLEARIEKAKEGTPLLHKY